MSSGLLGRAVLSCALTSAIAGSAHASVAPTEGTLATRDGAEIVDVPLRHTEVRVRVTGIVADLTVVQTFINPYKKKIDATYLFPLPTGAAVHDLAITTGGRTIVGEIARRDAARERYRLARQNGHVAALLTEERPNLFTQSVANIEPGATVEVTLELAEVLPWADGGYELAFPLVAGPRHVPASSKLTAEAAAALAAPVLPAGLRPRTDVQVTVDVEAGVPIAEVASPSHQLVVERPDPTQAHISLAAGDTVPNKDFILHWAVAGAAPTVAFAADGEHFVLVAQPPADVTPRAAAPKEVLFLLDTSSSMAGAPLAKAKEAVRRVVADLGPEDTFQIIRFDDGSSALGPRALANRPRNVKYALDWLEALDAGGGTDMIAGLDAALAYPRDAGRLHVIALLTDGFVGNEDEILARLVPRLGDARLFGFGVGSAVNRYLLEELAVIGRGAVEIVRPDEDTAASVRRFETRLDRPVWTDLAVDWKGLDVSDVTPARLPDLFAGQPLVVSGRWHGAAPASLEITGRRGGETVRVPIAVPAVSTGQPAARSEIGWLWARARIAELERSQLRGERPEVTEQITRLALAQHLVTRFTAFVAVDTSRVTRGGPGETVPVAVNVPDGVDRDRAGAAAGVGGGSVSGTGYGYGTVGHGSGGGGTGAGLVAHKIAAVPAVTMAIATPDAAEKEGGRFGKDDAHATDARAAVQACWAETGGQGSAELHLHVTTGADGHVAKLDLAGDALQRCVAARAKSWSFAPSHTLDFVVAVGAAPVGPVKEPTP